MLNFFVAVLLLGVGCCIGIVIGIMDCKKKFGIPRGEMPYV